MKPLVIDLFCGLGGWTKGFLAEGYRAVGFDIERHVYGEKHYPGDLVLQDILTVHGSQFKNAAAIVASPPCTEYSYMAMPWSRAKEIAAGLRGKGPFPGPYDGSRTVGELNRLFDACFRLQKEASEAAGRIIPMVVENVKGAQPWVGPARAHFGSFYLWGDVESVGGRIAGTVPRFGQTLRAAKRGRKNAGGSWFDVAHNTESGTGQNPVNGLKNGGGGRNFHVHEKTGIPTPNFSTMARNDGLENAEHVNKRDGASHTRHLTNPAEHAGIKQAGLSGEAWFNEGAARFSSAGLDRKAASAEIAEIPLDLAQWFARCFKP